MSTARSRLTCLISFIIGLAVMQAFAGLANAQRFDLTPISGNYTLRAGVPVVSSYAPSDDVCYFRTDGLTLVSTDPSLLDPVACAPRDISHTIPHKGVDHYVYQSVVDLVWDPVLELRAASRHIVLDPDPDLPEAVFWSGFSPEFFALRPVVPAVPSLIP